MTRPYFKLAPAVIERPMRLLSRTQTVLTRWRRELEHTVSEGHSRYLRDRIRVTLIYKRAWEEQLNDCIASTGHQGRSFFTAPVPWDTIPDTRNSEAA